MKLFISYRSLDSAKVDALVARLRSLKTAENMPLYEVWQDKYSILPGQDWWKAIVQGIIHCRAFIFMLSRESAHNPNCRAELSYARKRNRPIIPLVLEGEFGYNPVTGKNDIDYWEHIPPELNEIRAQFLFYEGVSVVDQLSKALAEFERKNWRDMPAPEPPDPRLTHEEGNDTGAIYDEACDYAWRLEFDTAERKFQRLVDLNDPDFGSEAYDWILLLRDYKRLVDWDNRTSTQYKVKPAWDIYRQKPPYPFLPDGIFDPKNFAARFISALPIVQENPTPVSSPRIQHDPTPSPSPYHREGNQTSPLHVIERGLGGKVKTADLAAAIRDIIGDPFDLCEVPAGEFLYEDEEDNPPQKLTLPNFAMGKYPITYSQYQVFIETKGGYHSPRWWEGLAQRNKTPGDQEWKVAARPRENVDWYDAMAFCRWLSFKLGGEYAIDKFSGWLVRLPTEFEWEKAARGTDGRMYPYGDIFDMTKCNTYESGEKSGMQRTSLVTDYPQGESPYGVMDMSGNVWEWCLSAYKDPKINPIEQDISTHVDRVVRGGSWFNRSYSARAVFRNRDLPDDCDANLGFRICCPIG